MPTKKEDLPGTLKRSPPKAQRTYAETLDSAEEQSDSEARAHQTAWSAVSTRSRRSATTGRPRTSAARPTRSPSSRAPRSRAPEADPRRRRRRGQHEAAALRAGQEGRCRRPLADDEVRARGRARPQGRLQPAQSSALRARRRTRARLFRARARGRPAPGRAARRSPAAAHSTAISAWCSSCRPPSAKERASRAEAKGSGLSAAPTRRSPAGRRP